MRSRGLPFSVSNSTNVYIETPDCSASSVSDHPSIIRARRACWGVIGNSRDIWDCGGLITLVVASEGSPARNYCRRFR